MRISDWSSDVCSSDLLIACPVCGDAEVRKAVMAPRVGAKSNQQVAPPVPAKPASEIATADPTPEQVRKLLAHIARNQAEMLPQSRWVGRAFADEARAMHERRGPKALSSKDQRGGKKGV